MNSSSENNLEVFIQDLIDGKVNVKPIIGHFFGVSKILIRKSDDNLENIMCYQGTKLVLDKSFRVSVSRYGERSLEEYVAKSFSKTIQMNADEMLRIISSLKGSIASKALESSDSDSIETQMYDIMRDVEQYIIVMQQSGGSKRKTQTKKSTITSKIQKKK